MEFYDAMCDPDRVVASVLARKLERERDEAREQRDRLAEALQNVINEDGTPISIDQAKVAIKSLNQPTELWPQKHKKIAISKTTSPSGLRLICNHKKTN